MLQNCGLFMDLPSEDPHIHLHNMTFVCKSVMGTQNLFMDVVGFHVFPLSFMGNAALWLSELSQSSITSWADL
ncbi:MAG: hypothetical protein Q8866_02450, partial [Candidatus Phytoplasma australasiaticum]|nr:hypothetical protein [Candidatus Phytoplasma australasiaticum]